jgi:hypothetical protein
MQVEDLGEEPIISELWSLDSENNRPRSQGLHVGQLINEESQDQGKRQVSTFTDSDLQAFMAMGFLWERVLEMVFRRVPRIDGQILRETEICKDGIFMSPDARLHSPGGDSVEEYKATSRSSKNPPKDEWISQMMAYCYGLGLNTANLRVLHYRGSNVWPVPKIRQYRYTFDDRELWENWERLLNFARSKGKL